MRKAVYGESSKVQQCHIEQDIYEGAWKVDAVKIGPINLPYAAKGRLS